MHNKARPILTSKITFEMVSNADLRKTVSFKEGKACTVRTLSSGMGIPYPTAHAILREKAGRKQGKGIPFGRFMDWHRVWLETEYNQSLTEVFKYKTLNQIIKAKGTFMVQVRGHMTVVKNGVVVDLIVCGIPNWRIKRAWKVGKPTRLLSFSVSN